MNKDETLKLALEALEASHFLIHGSETNKGVRVKWLGGFPQIGDRLYTSPPQRPWVGLTDEACAKLAEVCPFNSSKQIAAAIKARGNK